MSRLTLSLVFAVLLALSIAIKVHGGVGQNLPSPIAETNDDIDALLARNGFATNLAPPNTDPAWVNGVKGNCKLQIANVSLQGWHRTALEWAAAGRPIQYSVGGELYAEQPILKPMIVHYFNRLQRYLGISAPLVRARAILIDSGCPPDPISPADLRSLS